MEIQCPKCGSHDLIAGKKGFSGKKAVAGALLTGGIGILAGTIGSKKILITCLACGNKFYPGAQSATPKNVPGRSQKEPSRGGWIFTRILVVIAFVMFILISIALATTGEWTGFAICMAISLLFLAGIIGTSKKIKEMKKVELDRQKKVKKSPKEKPWFWVFLIVVFVGFVLTIKACSSDNRTPVSAIPELNKETEDKKFDKMVDSIKKANGVKPGTAVKPVTPVVSSSWEYSETEDPMGSHPMRFAIIEANEKVELKWPYGTVTAMIELQYRRGRNDAILRVSKGQFNRGVDDMPIKVKFDDGKVQTYYCGESSDGDATFAFIQGSAAFISRLKKAKTVMIEAEFYDDGVKDMEFDVTGLEWKH